MRSTLFVVTLLICCGLVVSEEFLSLKRACLNDCTGNGTCEANVCKCNAGYGGVDCSEDGGDPTCPAAKEALCSEYARCTNIAPTGSQADYICECYRGFINSDGQGYNCTDKNECEFAVCGKNAICTNTIGSYSCACQSGFQGNAYAGCTDIDECATGDNQCTANTTCSNSPGSYSCLCAPGYSVRIDDYTCKAKEAVQAPSSPVPLAPVSSGQGYTAILKVKPSILCWTRTPNSWNVYFQVDNHYWTKRVIGRNLQNAILIDGKSNADYPGLPTEYAEGITYPMFVNSLSAKSVGWDLDGFSASINQDDADPDFSSRRCPKEIKVAYSVELACPVDTASIQTAVKNQVTAALQQIATAKGIVIGRTVTVDVVGCTQKRSAGSITITVTDDSDPTDGATGSAMDVVYPLLGADLSASLSTVPGVSAPKGGISGAVDSSNLNPVEAIADPALSIPPPAPELGSISILTLAIILASVIFGIIFIIIMVVVIWRAKKKAAEERV